MDKINIYTAHHGDLDMRGYEVVRVQFFSFYAAKSVTFTAYGIRFSMECIRTLENMEYIKFHVHPRKKTLVIKPCEKTDRHAIKWARIKDGKSYSHIISGAAYINTIFELFNWLPEHKYRFRGCIKNVSNEIFIEFDLREPEIIIDKKILHPDVWDNRFGVDYYDYVHSKSIVEASSIETQHFFNLEPDIYPTAPKTLDSSINSIIDAINASET